ncbi:MAG: hypothetical protein KKE64_01300, partial [Candidatus Omnitrophica bacterium]|nr:hypothetical protein [Candidatus Omnitrophota bacterium]
MVIVFFIIFMLVMFLVLVFIMRSMLTKNVTSATNHLDELAREYAKKEDEVKKQLESAKRQSQEILSNAMADAQKQKEE